MSTVAFVFPHQLFAAHPVFDQKPDQVLLIEDSLFFGDRQYPMRFHKQKLAFHRASLAAYERVVEKRGLDCQRVLYQGPDSILVPLCARLAKDGVKRVIVTQLHDFMLEKRLKAACDKARLELQELQTPAFLNDSLDNRQWRESRKRWFMADFYQWQRKRLNILIDEDEKPVGGQWSFDEDNRKKLPNKLVSALPDMPEVRKVAHVREAIDSVNDQFADNPGELDDWFYPTTHDSAERWLDQFLEERFELFGPYEDAVVQGHGWLYHSVLTPMLNVGLLTPEQIVTRALEFASEHSVPLNSVEGFIRQIIGWREFMRATYEDLGVPMRTTNHWKHTRSLPAAFYDATTGIEPIDDVIHRLKATAYCHHIERLMILGGFMFLCEIDPDDIYRWFMEMFIDSYDWVMVPNVYAMSQHADGGAITTKPYFSGSNYVIKMSNYRKGDWSVTWDGLFWRWIDRNQKSLAGNPRWSMMVRNVEKMDPDKLAAHHEAAEAFLSALK